MNPERFARLREVLLNLAPLTASERESYLDRACGGDLDLRREVESLLARGGEDDELPAIAQTGGAARRFDLRPVAEWSPGDPLPERIGPYRVLGILGRGGMGVVYLAEQAEPLRREVAIKLVQPGLDQRSVLARFETERQALALMEHPGIARVLDAGAAADGRPYFVMEVVRGVSITEYCSTNALPIRDRLDLFRVVCLAVQHAHQKGIIHRDLKPSNLLVSIHDGKPFPRVIDFGIAKAIGEGSASATRTGMDQLMGTLAYMSPEQAGGRSGSVDTRSDVYSLGVVLHELVTGKLPYDTASRPLPDAVRVIADERPLVREVKESIDGRSVDEDLVTIITKALEKDPDRRYATAAAFAEDIERYLGGFPILARAPSTLYQLRKMVARHKVPVAFASTLAFLLIAFAVTTAMQLETTRREHARAEAEARKAMHINEFINNMLISVAPAAKGRDVTVREVLDRAAADVETGLAGEPEVQAAVRRTIGRTYREIGLYDSAAVHLEAALQTRTKLLGPGHAQTLESTLDLTRLHLRRGRPAAAESLLRAGMQASRDALAKDALLESSCNHLLTWALVNQGEYAPAESLAREVVAQRRVLGTDPEALAEALHRLSDILTRLGKYREAEGLARESLSIRRDSRGPDHPFIVYNLNILAMILQAQKRYAEAESLLREALALSVRVYGEDHPEVSMRLNNLAHLLRECGRFSEAETLFQQALAINRRRLDADHPFLATGLHNLASVKLERGDPVAAERLSREAIAIFRHPGVQRLGLPKALRQLGRSLEEQGRPIEAEAAFREAIAESRLVNAGPTARAELLEDLAALYITRGRPVEAEPLLRESVAILEQADEPDSSQIARARKQLGRCLDSLGRRAEAESLVARARLIEQAQGDTPAP